MKNIRIKKDSEIVNRLTKTKVWRDVDFAADRERYDGILRGEKRESDRQLMPPPTHYVRKCPSQ